MSLQIKSFHYLAEKRIHRQLSTPEEAWKLYDGLIKIHSIKSMIALKGTHRVTDNALSISPLTLLPPSETSVCDAIYLCWTISSSFVLQTMMLPASEGPEGTVIQHQEDLVVCILISSI